jgi:hypothetical protein
MGFEPMMRVLQTLALPLGHVALPDFRTARILTETPQLYKEIGKPESKSPFLVEGRGF